MRITAIALARLCKIDDGASLALTRPSVLGQSCSHEWLQRITYLYYHSYGVGGVNGTAYRDRVTIGGATVQSQIIGDAEWLHGFTLEKPIDGICACPVPLRSVLSLILHPVQSASVRLARTPARLAGAPRRRPSLRTWCRRARSTSLCLASTSAR